MYRLIVLLVMLVRYMPCTAQVLVSEEPRHRPVFQNKHVRLLNVMLPPGDTTQYHRHALPSLFLCFTKTTTGAQLFGQAPTHSTSAVGYMWFENLSPEHSKVHRVWNVDTSTFHVMDVELLSKDSVFKEKPLALKNLRITMDIPWVRAYTLALEKQKVGIFHKANRRLLLVAIETANVQLKQGTKSSPAQTVQPGTFFWISPDKKFSLKNTGSALTRFVLIEVH